MYTSKKGMSTQKLVLAAVLTAIVIVVQLLAAFTTIFGPFSTAMALIPIVIGAALCGITVGAWLGLVFSAVVLFTGGAALFFIYNPFGAIVTVLVKGTFCGAVAGIAYKALQKVNRYVAVFSAALLCPLSNTGAFLLGSRIFFLKYAKEMAEVAKIPNASGMEVFWVMAMGNFIFEVILNIVLVPITVRIIDYQKQRKAKGK